MKNKGLNKDDDFKILPSYSELYRMMENVLFNSSSKSMIISTGIGGFEEFINVTLKLGLPIKWALGQVRLEYYDGSPIYIIDTSKIKPMLQKALFLDLVGTVIKTKSGESFPQKVDDWDIPSGILPRIKAYKEEGFHIIIVSNEGGIELGKTTATEVEERIERICKEIEQYIGIGVNYCYAGYADRHHYMKKPNPGMAYTMALQLELSLRNSVMVGDTESDAKFAKEAFIGTYLDVKDFIEERITR